MSNHTAHNVAHTLRQNNMSVTESRRRILELFMLQPANALKHADIEQSLQNFDRVTIYRTLQSFSEKGIIHHIPNVDGTAMYALCSHQCGQGHHHDNHVHFLCEVCGTTQCLDGVTIPPVRLPQGFVAKHTDMVVNGTCKQCITT